MATTGLGRAALVEEIEEKATEKRMQWDLMRAAAKTPDVLYLFAVQLIKDGSQSMKKEFKHNAHLQAVNSRLALLKDRTALRITRSRASDEKIQEICQKIINYMIRYAEHLLKLITKKEPTHSPNNS
jgi:hypothetical protein